MRVVIAGDYPEAPPTVVGGIQAVIYGTLDALGEYNDLDLHVVTCEKWRVKPRDRVDNCGRWTVHYLPSSPQVPHSLSMLTTDRRTVRRRIAALAPDLVHAHGQAAAYPLAAFDSGLPTVLTVHGISMLEAQVDRRGGLLASWLRVVLWGGAERRSLRRASDIVAISPFVRQAITPYTQARLHVIENPVQNAFFHLDRRPRPRKVLLVGSLQKRKGILEAIKAMAIVRQHLPDSELHIAGGLTPAYRPYGEMVHQYVENTHARDYAHFLGHLGHEALCEAYSTSQVFLMPSYLEASPVVLAEAMAAGLPSVVSDIESTAHLVEDGVTGYRVPVGDVQALAERITRLLLDEETRQRFGQRARKVAIERFTQELAARKTHDLYLALGRDPSRRTR